MAGQLGVALGIGSVCCGLLLQGYVRTQPLGQQRLARWPSERLELRLDTRTLPPGVSAAAMLEAAQAAAKTWSAPEVSCTALRIVVWDGEGRVAVGASDGISSIGFHLRHFCRAGVKRGGACYDPRIAAMTTLHFGERRVPETDDVEIVEADIELNAVDFGWVVGSDTDNDPSVLDLQSVLIHELGHVLGFEHVCEHGLASRPRDDKGAPRPRCAEAPQLLSSVMAPAADDPSAPRVHREHALNADDLRGLCEVYPRSVPSGGGCGCSVSPSPPAGWLGPSSLLLAFGLWLPTRRRHRSWIGSRA